MKQFSFRVADKLYEKAQNLAARQDVSLSDFLRNAVRVACAARDAAETQRNSGETQLAELVQTLREELATKNQQIDQLHQLVAMAQKSADEWVGQLKRSQAQLEDMRGGPKSFWARWFQRQKNLEETTT